MESRLRQARTHWRIMALGVVILGSSTIASYTFVYVVTYAQAILHMAARAGFFAESIGHGLRIPAVLLGGWLSDKHGRRPINVWGNFAFVVLIYPTFSWVISTHSEFALIAGMSILSAISQFMWGSFFAALTESLPKSIRSGGFGVVQSISVALFGGTTQLIATWLMYLTGSAMAPAWYLIAAAVVGQVALMLMAESAPMKSPRPLELTHALPS